MFLRDAAGGMEQVIATHAGEPLVFNDITVGPGGAVYGGTFHWNAAGMEQPGRLLLVRGAGETTVLDEGILLANGLGFSPDSSRLYFTDTIARKIYRYAVDPDTGLVADRRVFVDVPASEGLPDGLAVDAEGCVWSAQWYAGAVLRYDPDGRCIDRIALPVQQVSSLAFGGADLGDVYVTTAAEYWPSEYQPPGFDPAGRMGGGLYRMRVGVRGQMARRATLAAGVR
jgi:D-xylonolactonase